MARVNVRCWQETYRGLMSDAVLDDPGLPAARERFWTAALTDERYRENRVAVAERDGELVGIAMSGPPLDVAAAWTRQLYVLNVYAADHGTGAGPALLEAVVDPEESAALWVADPNPRAQAFYRKHGFVADGTAQVEDGCGRSAWSAACSTVGSPARRRAPGQASSPGWASAAGRAAGDIVAPVASGKLGPGGGLAGTDADEVGEDGGG
jgi:GNAT superfamily N-acetyltransferase